MNSSFSTAGSQVRRAFTMVELLVVIVIIAILAGLLLPAVIGGIKKADITQAQTEAKLIEAAINAYYVDYGKFPGQHVGRNEDPYWDYNSLISTLRGSNIISGNVSSKDTLGLNGSSRAWINQNPRGRIYLQVSDKSISTNSGSSAMWYPKVYTQAQMGDLADPWGNRYVMVPDMNRDGIVSADGESLRRNVAVWSWGPDPSATNLVPNQKSTIHIRSWR